MSVVRTVLAANPDIEVRTVDGDTPLLRYAHSFYCPKDELVLVLCIHEGGKFPSKICKPEIVRGIFTKFLHTCIEVV